MANYRKIEPLGKVADAPIPGAAPEFIYASIDQLVINGDYQRDLSKSSARQIARVAKNWDWNAYKAPSIARTDKPGVYEVIDGQHTVIAAATNGNIPFLPCLLGNATSTEEKAGGFIGINKNRIALTPSAIFRAEVAKGDPTALIVQKALDDTECVLLQTIPTRGKWKVGETTAVSTLRQLASTRGGDRLTALLRIARNAGAGPVSSMILKGLDMALPFGTIDEVTIERTTAILKGQGVARLEVMAKSRTAAGGRSYATLADMIAEYLKLPNKRMGAAKDRKSEAVAAGGKTKGAAAGQKPALKKAA